MAEHTPGPWRANGNTIEADDKDGRSSIVAWGSDDRESCVPEGEAEANNRLIAAAPDMLAALQQIACFEKAPRRTAAQANAAIDAAIYEARAAIRKATGEGEAS